MRLFLAICLNDSSTVFEEYTTMIEQLFLLAQTVNRHAAAELNPLGRDASAIMMETILPMTEYVGRFRGMGSGLVTSKRSTEAQSTMMRTIAREIKSLDVKLQTRDVEVLAKPPRRHRDTDSDHTAPHQRRYQQVHRPDRTLFP